MPIIYEEYRRRPGVDRNDLGAAVLNLCRTLRANNDKIKSAKFYWASYNDIALIVEGEVGFRNTDGSGPSPDVAKATSAMYDLADQTYFRELAEARLGQNAWEAAGRPSGT
jgi:hypothetical protein